MLKKFLLCLSLLSFLATKGFAITLADMPEQFTVNERLLSWTSTFDVETPNYRIGTVHRKFFSWTLEYDFFNIQEQLQAKARMRWLTFGAVFDVTDGTGAPIGMVEERVFTFFPTFDMFSPLGEKLATAKMNFWQTRYTLTDPVTNQEIAILSRPFFRWTSNWTVDIVNPALFAEKNINPALFIIVMAFQTDREHWNRQAERDAERDNDNDMDLTFASLNPGAPNNSLCKSKLDQIIPYLRSQLEVYRSQFEGLEPSEADFEAIEKRVELVLNAKQQEAKTFIDKIRLAYGLQQIMPLLDNPELKPGEKSALFLLIDRALASVE